MNATEWLFVDAHVHLHDCFPLASFLNAATANMRRAADDAHVPFASSRRILLFTESSGDDAFQRLAGYAQTGREECTEDGQAWAFHQAGESGALLARRSDGAEVYLFAGSQIVTGENLEVLALASPVRFPERKPLAETVRAVGDAGGMPVVPWGFGKWLGRRGKILRDFLKSNPGRVWLGDNRGRPVFWPRPTLFTLVEQQGGRVLPGSDPLPFASEAHTVAGFGFMAQGRFDPGKPLSSVKSMLLDPATSLRPYGRQEHPVRFVRNQIAMQLRKRALQKSTPSL